MAATTEASKELETLLANRPNASELVEKNILKDPKVAAALQPSAEDLRHKLEHRPPKEELVEHNILKDSHVAPALQAREAELARSRLEDSLEKKIHDRPAIDELRAKGLYKDE